MNKYLLTFLICITIVILDQLSKYLVTIYIPLYSSIDILPVLDFTHIRNTGVAFGMLQNLPASLKLPFFIVVFLVAVVVVISIIRNTDSSHKSMIIGLSLILAGAIGNSIDRFRLGYVTDFIDFHWFNNP
ncbi:MAG: signal peptidase II, partial [Thermodesulfobacteriota bacterium]